MDKLYMVHVLATLNQQAHSAQVATEGRAVQRRRQLRRRARIRIGLKIYENHVLMIMNENEKV